MSEKEIIDKIKDAEKPSSEEAEATAQMNQRNASDAKTDGSNSEPLLGDIKNELEQVTDRLQRQAAEFQNYRRRTEQEKSQMVVFGKSMVISQLLDVFDDFYRSIESTNQIEDMSDSAAAFESLKSGVELAYNKLMDELKKMDVEPIVALGQPFDEELHEAVMQQPVANDEEVGIVLTEIQRGFRMGERVLRHSKVIVSAANPAKDA